MGIISVYLFYIMPALFIYFLFSKFYYIYFFDPKHPTKDWIKSLGHAVVYTIVFSVVLIGAYSVSSVNFFNTQNEAYLEQLENNIDGFSALEEVLTNEPIKLQELEVFKELNSQVGKLRADMESEITLALNKDNTDITFKDIAQDKYFRTISENNYNLIKFTAKGKGLIDMKHKIVDKYMYATILANQGLSFSDGTTTIEDRLEKIKPFVDEQYSPFEISFETIDLIEKFDDPNTKFKVLKENMDMVYHGKFFKDSVGLGSLINFKVPFQTGVYNVLSHSHMFKEGARFIFKSAIYWNIEENNPDAMEILYQNRNKEESQISALIRYEILYDWVIKQRK